MGQTTTREETAIDRWVSQSLSQRYAAVLREPIPDELLSLLRRTADR